MLAETRQAIADGADEIDLVIPYRAFMAGDEQAVRTMISEVRKACPSPVLLKTILETGELKDRGLIRNASHIAIQEGADFIKTSTGKVTVNATLEAADIMLTCIRESGRKVGFKPAGGVRTVGDARLYLTLAATIHSPDWPMPSTFRFGASGLLTDILSGAGRPRAGGRRDGLLIMIPQEVIRRKRNGESLDGADIAAFILGLTDGIDLRGAGGSLRHGRVVLRHEP